MTNYWQLTAALVLWLICCGAYAGTLLYWRDRPRSGPRGSDEPGRQ